MYDKDANIETFNVKLSEMSGRLDASYHVPIVKAITDHLKLYAAEVTTINDTRISKKIILPVRFKCIYVGGGQEKVFLGGKQLYELDPSNKKYLYLVHHEKRIIEQLEFEENMILITCSGTIGKVTQVPKHWENWTANQHIIRIVPSSNEIAGYLSIFLGSVYGYSLINRFTYGAVLDEIDDNHIGQRLIPLLKNTDIQTEINNMDLDANSKRYEAYKLEQQPMIILEEDILCNK